MYEYYEELKEPHTTKLELINAHGTYTISLHKQGMTVTELFDEMIIPLLQAAGYEKESIRDTICELADLIEYSDVPEHQTRQGFSPP